MKSFLKRLRSLGALGAFAANVLKFLTINWALALTAIIGLWASLNDWTVAATHDPRVQTFVLVFLVLLWTIIGITSLIDRQRPRIVKSEQDFRYGLTFEGLIPALGSPDFSSDDSALHFGVQVRNFSQGPLKYTIEDFDVRIGNRAIPKLKPGEIVGYMQRGAGRTSHSAPFKRRDFKELFGQQLTGTVYVLIKYGHPEEPPVRRLEISMGLTLQIPVETDKPFAFGSNILSEVDSALDD